MMKLLPSSMNIHVLRAGLLLRWQCEVTGERGAGRLVIIYVPRGRDIVESLQRCRDDIRHC